MPVSQKHQHVQASPLSIWNVNHNLQTNYPIVDCYVDVAGTLTKILPVSIVITDANNIVITFSAPRFGGASIR